MNYYERHIGDYLKDTAHLSLLEHGIYTRLLDVYYTREGALPGDQVARLVGARSPEEREALDCVLREFFVKTETGDWVQQRCEREIERYNKRAEHNRRVGQLGGRPRKVETQTEPAENPVGSLREPEANPPSNQKPVTSTSSSPTVQKKARTRAADRPEDVSEAVWEEYSAFRRGRKAIVSDGVVQAVRVEAEKAGMTLEQALQTCCQRGWTGFQAEWVLKVPARPVAQSFRERDQAAAAARVAQFSPSVAARAVDPNVIDMEAPNARTSRLSVG